MIWFFGLLFGLYLLPAAAQRGVGVVPPQPVALAVKVPRSGKTEISLRIHGQAGEPLKFLIRTPPLQGRLSEPRLTAREAAAVSYEPPADLAITSDKFFYAAQGFAGVSAAVEVAITIVDLPPQLVIPDVLDFAPLRPGATATKLLELTNSGGGMAAGEVIVEAPWRIEGRTGYRLGAGDLAVFKLLFAPAAGGVFEGVARFTSDPAHSTTLRGTAEAAITAVPSEITLQNEPNDPVRRGAFELVNQTDEPRTLRLRADARLQLPGEITLPPRGRSRVAIETAPGAVQALDAEIRIESADLVLRVPVKAAAAGAIMRANPPVVAFGQRPVGRPAGAQFALENIGGAAGEIRWSIAAPFRTPQNSTLLLPGEKRTFVIEVESKTPGQFRAWLQCAAGAQTFDVPVQAELVAASLAAVPVLASRAAPSTTTAAPPNAAPIAEPDADPAAEPNPTPIVPKDWFPDARLPAGVHATALNPTTAVVIWPVQLSPATQFRVELRQLGMGAEGEPLVSWLELPGLPVRKEGENYSVTIHELQPSQPWTVRVLPLKADGTPDERLFAVAFTTPAASSSLFSISPLRALLVALFALIAWQAVVRWRRRR